MTIEPGATYRGHDTSRLRVYHVDEEAGIVLVEQPTTLIQRSITIADFEAWAKDRYVPTGQRGGIAPL